MDGPDKLIVLGRTQMQIFVENADSISLAQVCRMLSELNNSYLEMGCSRVRLRR
jgi:hypothetical protein